jgi:hypothetical protein
MTTPKIACPKCGSLNVRCIEHGEYYETSIVLGITPAGNLELESLGLDKSPPDETCLLCGDDECGHEWRLSGD